MIKDRVIAIVKKQLKIDKVDVTANLQDDYQVDSIGVLDFIMSIEDEFGIEVEDDALETMTTVQDVIDYVENKTSRLL